MKKDIIKRMNRLKRKEQKTIKIQQKPLPRVLNCNKKLALSCTGMATYCPSPKKMVHPPILNCLLNCTQQQLQSSRISENTWKAKDFMKMMTKVLMEIPKCTLILKTIIINIDLIKQVKKKNTML